MILLLLTVSCTLGDLTHVKKFEDIRFQATNVTRVNSIDLVSMEDGDGVVVPICHLFMAMPFSIFRPDRLPLNSGVFQSLAAVLLAIDYLNSGNGKISRKCKCSF